MTVVFARGGPDCTIGADTMREAVRAALAHVGDASRILILPPDATRPHSRAGLLTKLLCAEARNGATCDIMPALGTHSPMTPAELRRMFGPDIPPDCFKEHNWREDLVRLGSVPSRFVHEASAGVLGERMPDFEIPVEVSRRIVEGAYDAIFSVGQVVPHEVAGMANGFKNVLVGAGGRDTINRTHFLGAVYGMERMMGRAETPVRAVLDYAHEHYLQEFGIVYIMTVVALSESGEMATRGIYAGDDAEAFRLAAELSRGVNVTILDAPQQRVVAYLEPDEFKSTWLGNKAIYRTRMAIAPGG
ncbi:MAG: lactate racemase domain-containing protein, partial [Planctomycetota bacterium]